MTNSLLRRPIRTTATAVAVLGLAAGCASFDNWQRKAIFQHESAERWTQFDTPADADPFELALSNGERVHAWYLPAAQAEQAPTVLFLHGARRNLNGSVPRIERLRGVGFNVLAIDYRGFGKSSSRVPSEQSAIEDTRSAFEELKRREPDGARRFVYGYSLGGALAIDLAARESGIAGVIVEASFTNVSDLVRTSKWGWMPGLSVLVTQEFDSLRRIAQVDEPMMFLHGLNDGVVPHQMSDRLAAAATRVPVGLKRVFKVEGANHRGVQSIGGARYDDALRAFAQAATQSASAAEAAARGASAATAPAAAEMAQ